MNSKKRILNSINRKKTDRIPIYVTLTPQIGDALCSKFNIGKIESFKSGMAQRIIYADVLNHLGNDCVGIGASYPKNFSAPKYEDGLVQDEWGVRWKSTGMYNEISYHPLSEIESIKDLEKIVFPDAEISDRYTIASEMAKKYAESYAIIGCQDSICFEAAWYMTGLEKLLIDLALEKEYVTELFDRILNIKIAEAKHLIDCGADIIWTGDDVGDQNGMMMSPGLWRKYLKPRVAKFIETLHSYNSKIKIAYHSCGSIIPIIPDLIEIKLDILNPLQPNVAGMDYKRIKSEYGEKICFFGAIDVQYLMPKGTAQEIKNKVLETISILGEGGGYILAPAHNIQPDTPIENIITLFETVRNSSN